MITLIEPKVQKQIKSNKLLEIEVKKQVERVIEEVIENTCIPEESELTCSVKIEGEKAHITFTWKSGYKKVFNETRHNTAEYKPVYDELYESFYYSDCSFEDQVYGLLEFSITTNF